MTDQQLKDAVLQAQQEFNAKVAQARAGDVSVNLWITGPSPTHTGPSLLDLDFGVTE